MTTPDAWQASNPGTRTGSHRALSRLFADQEIQVAILVDVGQISLAEISAFQLAITEMVNESQLSHCTGN